MVTPSPLLETTEGVAEAFIRLKLRPGSGGANGEAEESFSFSRWVSIADEVDTAKVSAAYENGVLTVTLPKREEAKPKKITVAVK